MNGQQVVNNIKEKIKSYAEMYSNLSMYYSKLDLDKAVKVLSKLKTISGSFDFFGAMHYSYLMSPEEREIVFTIHTIIMTELNGLRFKPEEVTLLELYNRL